MGSVTSGLHSQACIFLVLPQKECLPDGRPSSDARVNAADAGKLCTAAFMYRTGMRN
jgi:hypothetical protein